MQKLAMSLMESLVLLKTKWNGKCRGALHLQGLQSSHIRMHSHSQLKKSTESECTMLPERP